MDFNKKNLFKNILQYMNNKNKKLVIKNHLI